MNLGNELDPKRDEIERLLRTAHIYQVRGEREKAKELLQQALALDAENASVWELLGDYRREAGDWQGAHDAYKKAHELNPTSAPIERKYAEAVLQLARQQEQYQQWERALEGKGSEDALALPRNPGLAFLLSFLMPGVGQLYNGQFVKGGIILGVMLVGVVVFLITPGGSDFIYNLLAYLVNPARVRGTVSSTQLITALVMFITWVYAFIDAPLSAAARNRLIE
ncbi:MAG: tetratricopeptide repeat protein [Fimbriimonadales bacterium]|nr:tetratricopeptide repeat protein [Fimbriimonadales bacterium]MCS7190945.1 tetratricopeptide repeat protein [Fimbriimonadales bacterium]